MRRLQLPAQRSIRNRLRIAGPLILLVGLICTITSFVCFFTKNFGLFWLGFVGMPLMFVGSVFCMYGFMGAVGRYVAGESAPVAADTVNYMAEETKGAVETVSKAMAKGVVEGIDEARARQGEGKD